MLSQKHSFLLLNLQNLVHVFFHILLIYFHLFFFFFHLLETIQMPNGKVMKRTMEYYSVIRRKAALLILAWMKCKEIMLNGKIDLERMHTTRLRRVTVMK